MNMLAVSDVELGFIYNAHFAQRFKNIDLMISCGDLPYYYLEFMVSMIDKPLYYVRGNHVAQVERTIAGERRSPWGAIDLHRKVLRTAQGLLIGGIQGSLWYNDGPCQYTQAEMWSMILAMVPGLMVNRIRYGRYLDIFVSHAPPWKIHDMDDLPHRGIKAFRWLLQVFRPRLHLHGHIHVYRPDVVTTTRFRDTLVMNCYGYREFSLTDQFELESPPDSYQRFFVGKESDVKRIG
jgi:Icc-related predicted phosphoesterase